MCPVQWERAGLWGICRHRFIWEGITVLHRARRHQKWMFAHLIWSGWRSALSSCGNNRLTEQMRKIRGGGQLNEKSRQRRVTKEENSGRVRSCSHLNTAAFCEATFASCMASKLHSQDNKHSSHYCPKTSRAAVTQLQNLNLLSMCGLTILLEYTHTHARTHKYTEPLTDHQSR